MLVLSTDLLRISIIVNVLLFTPIVFVFSKLYLDVNLSGFIDLSKISECKVSFKDYIFLISLICLCVVYAFIFINDGSQILDALFLMSLYTGAIIDYVCGIVPYTLQAIFIVLTATHIFDYFSIVDSLIIFGLYLTSFLLLSFVLSRHVGQGDIVVILSMWVLDTHNALFLIIFIVNILCCLKCLYVFIVSKGGKYTNLKVRFVPYLFCGYIISNIILGGS